MSRTPLFDQFARTLQRALEPADAPDQAAVSRRRVLGDAGKLAAAGALASVPGVGTSRRAGAAPASPDVSVGIVGAGLAGLVCADELQRAGIAPHLYDAADYVGGRVRSLAGFFLGQVAERGGEFIDTGHKTLINYARQFGLTLEDVNKQPGEVTYYLNGRHVPEAAVVGEFRAFVDVMRADLRNLSGGPTARTHTPADAALDRISLAEYLDGRNALGVPCAPIARAAIEQAYLAEYGREISLRRLDLIALTAAMSMLVDVDHVGTVLGWPTVFRSGHSVGFVLAAPLLMAWLAARFDFGVRPLTAGCLALAAILAHIAWDTLTAPGVPMWLPFTVDVTPLGLPWGIALEVAGVAAVWVAAAAERRTAAVR